VFSKLQRTLTDIRSTMKEDRLESLLLLQCHRDLCPTTEEVLDEFATEFSTATSPEHFTVGVQYVKTLQRTWQTGNCVVETFLVLLERW